MERKAVSEVLPDNNEEVLLNHQGTLYLAVFEKEGQVFRNKDGSRITIGSGDSWHRVHSLGEPAKQQSSQEGWAQDHNSR